MRKKELKFVGKGTGKDEMWRSGARSAREGWKEGVKR